MKTLILAYLAKISLTGNLEFSLVTSEYIIELLDNNFDAKIEFTESNFEMEYAEFWHQYPNSMNELEYYAKKYEIWLKQIYMPVN